MAKSIKWFITTMLVGLIPIFVRGLFSFFLQSKGTFQGISISDLILWGFVLNISMFNERDGFYGLNPAFREVTSVVPLFMIGLFFLVFTCGLVNEILPSMFNQWTLITTSIIFDCITLIVGLISIIICTPKQKQIKQDQGEKNG
jgi:hypothetical protein